MNNKRTRARARSRACDGNWTRIATITRPSVGPRRFISVSFDRLARKPSGSRGAAMGWGGGRFVSKSGRLCLQEARLNVRLNVPGRALPITRKVKRLYGSGRVGGEGEGLGGH